MNLRDMIKANMDDRDPKLVELADKLKVKTYAAARGVKSAKTLFVFPEEYLIKQNNASNNIQRPYTRTNYGQDKGEWWYSEMPTYSYVEEYIPQSEGYQWHCYQGEPFLLQIKGSKMDGGKTERVVDMDKNPMPIINPRDNKEFNYPLPENFDEQRDAARRLAEDLYYVRVDLYNHNGEIYISEMTFAPVAGKVDYEVS